jgi:nucleoside-diphosphate-sugar epimerase
MTPPAPRTRREASDRARRGMTLRSPGTSQGRPARRVLVTGSSGAIGYFVCAGLEARGHAVRGYDRGPARRSGEHVMGELGDVAKLKSAMQGIEVVVHLAATADSADFVTDLVPNNIVGTHNVFEAAVAAGAERVVYASTLRVVAGLGWGERATPLTAADGLHPHDFYSLTKCCGELMGEMYVTSGKLSVICARCGWLVRNREEAARMDTSEAAQRVYLSHRDGAQFFCRAVEAEGVKFAQLFATSKNRGQSVLDLTAAREIIGYEPVDSWPEGSSWDEREFPSPVAVFGR